MDQHFAYAIDRRYLPVLVPFGLRPAKDGVTLTDGSFLATFGFFRLTMFSEPTPVFWRNDGDRNFAFLS